MEICAILNIINHVYWCVMLKGQDIALLAKLILKQGKEQRTDSISLAYELNIGQSEVSKAMQRLEHAKLISRYDRKELEIHKHAVQEMMTHGLKYFIAPEYSMQQRGMITAYGGPELRDKFLSEEVYVWPYIDGEHKGIGLEPLYKSLPSAVARFPDEDFYNWMTLLDLIRIGGSRETQIATELLEKSIWHTADKQQTSER